jgi:hypothetical protein
MQVADAFRPLCYAAPWMGGAGVSGNHFPTFSAGTFTRRTGRLRDLTDLGAPCDEDLSTTLVVVVHTFVCSLLCSTKGQIYSREASFALGHTARSPQSANRDQK